MKKKRTVILALGVFMALQGFSHPMLGAEPSKTERLPIYDESADSAKQVTEAQARAKKENKNVLLQFGANWCGWCHKLHKLFEADAEIAGVLKESYIVVMVDVNKGHNTDIDQRYQNPTRFGLPALVVLDSAGKVLVSQDSGKLEEGDHHDPKKVLAFLNEWAGKK